MFTVQSTVGALAKALRIFEVSMSVGVTRVNVSGAVTGVGGTTVGGTYQLSVVSVVPLSMT